MKRGRIERHTPIVRPFFILRLQVEKIDDQEPESNTSNTNKARAYRNRFHKLAASSIKDFLSHVDRECEFLALIELAAEAMSAVAWIVEEELEIEWVFAQCKETTLRSLKDRVDRWLSKSSAVEAQNKAAH